MYCPKCGKKGDDDAKYCNQCGASLSGEKRDIGKEMERGCDEDCSGRKHPTNFVYFWVVIIGLIIVAVIISIIIKFVQVTNVNMHFPTWVTTSYWDFCGLLIALAILLFILIVILKAIKRN